MIINTLPRNARKCIIRYTVKYLFMFLRLYINSQSMKKFPFNYFIFLNETPINLHATDLNALVAYTTLIYKLQFFFNFYFLELM